MVHIIYVLYNIKLFYYLYNAFNVYIIIYMMNILYIYYMHVYIYLSTIVAITHYDSCPHSTKVFVRVTRIIT